jgi:hypothetical protein
MGFGLKDIISGLAVIRETAFLFYPTNFPALNLFTKYANISTASGRRCMDTRDGLSAGLWKPVSFQ